MKVNWRDALEYVRAEGEYVVIEPPGAEPSAPMPPELARQLAKALWAAAAEAGAAIVERMKH